MARMVFKATITAEWSGADFDGINAARKIIAGAVHDIGKAMNVEVEYAETVANVRAKDPK